MSEKRNIWNNLIEQCQECNSVEFQSKAPRGSATPITRFESKIPDEDFLSYIGAFELIEVYALDLTLNLIIRDAFRYIINHPISIAKDSLIKKLDSKILKKISALVDWDIFIKELNDQGVSYKKRKEINTSAEMEKVSEIQYATQFYIENCEIGWRQKAEAFLYSHLMTDITFFDNEALIYMLTRPNKPKLLENVLKAYSNPLSSQDSLGIELIWQLKDHVVELEDRLSKIIEYQSKRTKNLKNLQYDKGEFIEYPDIFRFLNVNNIQYLMTFIAQIPENTRNRLLPEQIPDFSKPFSFLRCSAAIQFCKQKIERLLWDIHCVIDECGSEFPEFLIKDKAPTPSLLSLYVFGAYRIESELLKEKTLHRAVRYLRYLNIPILPEEMPSSTPPFNGISATAMYIHAMGFAGNKEKKSFLLPYKEWLLNNQSAYGCWYDWGDNPLFTTVMVLDAMSVIDGDDKLSFPLKAKHLIVPTDPNQHKKPLLIIDCVSKSIQYGDLPTYRPKFKGGKSKVWDFITGLSQFKEKKMPLSRFYYLPGSKERKDWKNQYDTLCRNLGGYDVMKHFIISNGDSYELTNNVKFVNTSIQAKADSEALDNYEKRKYLTKRRTITDDEGQL